MVETTSRWVTAAVAVAILVAARGLAVAVWAGWVNDDAIWLVGMMVWGASLVMLLALIGMPTPEDAWQPGPHDSALRRLAYRLSMARRWNRDARAVVIYIYGGLLGFIIAITVMVIVEGEWEVIGQIILAAIVGAMAAPIYFPAAMLGLALCPPVGHHPDRQLDPKGRRLRWVLFAGGFASGVMLLVIQFFGDRLLFPMSMMFPLLLIEVYLTLLPATATFAIVRLALATGLLRRADEVDLDPVDLEEDEVVDSILCAAPATDAKAEEMAGEDRAK